ncbi:hypothetical protein [Shewanella baltica]|uniref:hypothetical protein n=1 Tax=Shewanella baltica TaxID=62322 RepID=UPI00217E8A1C|nr:hypothetical protein [Shewanella baltica]MCS6190287.1 hypothetical protein [Shewanella baltica]
MSVDCGFNLGFHIAMSGNTRQAAGIQSPVTHDIGCVHFIIGREDLREDLDEGVKTRQSVNAKIAGYITDVINSTMNFFKRIYSPMPTQWQFQIINPTLV